MTTTTTRPDATAPVDGPDAPASVRPALGRTLDWWAGLAGLAFLVSLLVQNALRGAYVPLGEVTAADLRGYVVDHRWVIDTIDALVAVNAACLLLFVAGVYRRTQDGAGAIWARVGLLGATGIVGLFLTTVAVETTMAARGGSMGDELLETLWALHNAVFAVTLIGVAAALVGFGLASVAAGLIPRWFRIVAPLGATLMIVTGGATVAVAEGSPVLAVGMVGFLGWLAFLVAAGSGLMRSAA